MKKTKGGLKRKLSEKEINEVIERVSKRGKPLFYARDKGKSTPEDKARTNNILHPRVR